MGMLNAAYFTSRGELLEWINNLLELNYTKIEELANGAAFCQVLDCLYPGMVKLGRVNFNAHTEPEMISNYKVLQEVLDKAGIKRNVPVDVLIKGKYQASLEMTQWLKGFFEQEYSGEPYDAAGRRAHFKCKDPVVQKTKQPCSARSLKPSVPPRAHQAVTHQVPANHQVAKPAVKSTVGATRPAPKPASSHTDEEFAQLKKELADMRKELDDMKEDNQTLLEERNFYYEKLQKAEALCQSNEGNELSEQILKILYETDEANGFVSPDELDI